MANHKRAMRFGELLSDIELSAKAIQAGAAHDVPMVIYRMRVLLEEAQKIANEVSREVLDELLDG